jgi:hypothetical protein
MIVLAFTVFTMSTPAISPDAAKPFNVAVICTKSGEHTSGLTKVCYYSCVKSEGAVTVPPYEACPAWKPRWRLNRTGHFGPNPTRSVN